MFILNRKVSGHGAETVLTQEEAPPSPDVLWGRGPCSLAPHPSHPPAPYRQVGAQRSVLLTRRAAALLQRARAPPGTVEEAPQQAGLEVRQQRRPCPPAPARAALAPAGVPTPGRREAGYPGETRNRPRERAEPGAERPLPERRRAEPGRADLHGRPVPCPPAGAPGLPQRPTERRRPRHARLVWRVRLRGHQPPSAPADALAHPKRYWARPSGVPWTGLNTAEAGSGFLRTHTCSPCLRGIGGELPPAESRQH